MNILNEINFQESRYRFPAYMYPVLLFGGWLWFGSGSAKKLEMENPNLEKTEYLNPSLPKVSINDDGIGNRTDNMIKSFGQIQDFSAVENIEQTTEEQVEEYESRYSEADFAMLEKEALARSEEMMRLQKMQSGARAQSVAAENTSALAELEKALAEARLKGQRSVESAVGAVAEPPVKVVAPSIKEEREKANSEVAHVVKVRRPSSSYFNTIGENAPEPSLIKAIIDEELTAIDGSRVRLRLLDDIEVNELVLPKGSYLYALVSGFGSQRIKGKVSSLMIEDELVTVDLSIYDTDGMEGLYVPNSAFRETAKEIAGGTIDNSLPMSSNTSNMNSFAQWGLNALQNAYQKSTSAIAKSIRQNKAKIKYGTFVYLINGNKKS